ncbi:unnamed protein product [Orchesella dallaii]|uniref:Uncharacterized protein n=1 Tax=Orchesella dallaii TaxID=48710 RepID=A0ABP1PSW3_9HEXA
MDLVHYQSLEPQGAIIPSVQFTNLQPDVMCDMYKHKIMEYGYLKASVTGITATDDSWDQFYKEEKQKHHRCYKVDRLTADVNVVSLSSTKKKWKRERGTVTIEEAIGHLESICKGEADSYQVVYLIIEKPGTVRSLRHLHIESCFEKLKSAIHIAFEEQEWVDGVHTLYVFGGQKKTLFPLHDEDNKMESINVNMYGADKWWDVVIPKDSDKLRSACQGLKAELQLHTREVLCEDFLQHKNILLTDAFFKKHGIRYHRVRQQAGTMMIIGPDTYHQGVNLGENIAIAVNFTSTVWLSSVYESRRFLIDNQCRCEGISAPFADDKLRRIANIHQLTLRHLTPYVNLQPSHYNDNADQRTGSSDDKKRTEEPKHSFTCPRCNRIFNKHGNVTRHLKNQHRQDPSQQFLCNNCNQSFSTKGNLTKHLKNNNCI